MLEWLKRHAWKACILQKSIGGSNPPLSAKHLKLSAQRWAFSVQGRQELAPVRTCTEKAQGRKAMSFKCFARAPAASGRGKVTLCVANPPREAGREPAKERSDCANPRGATKSLRERDSPHLSSDYFPQPFRCQIFYANRKQTGRFSKSVIDNRCNTTPRPCVRQIKRHFITNIK